MWFDLALALGHRSVRECQHYIDSDEFADWMAYRRISPWGWERVDLAAATAAQAFGGGRLQDYLPNFRPSYEPIQTVEQMKTLFRSAAESWPSKSG